MRGSTLSGAPPLSAALEDALQCPVCMDAFDLQQHIPQLLHSSHTVCSTCIDTLCSHASSTRIRCPQCQTEVDSTLRVNNTVVVHMLEAMQRHERERAALAAAAAAAQGTDGDEEKKQPSPSTSSHTATDDSDSEQPGAPSPSSAATAKKKKSKKKKKKNKPAAPAGPDSSSPHAISTASSAASASSATASPSVTVPVGSSAASAASVSRGPSRLSDTRLFPCYKDLPEPWEPNSTHYVARDGRRYPKYHWAYVGEIKAMQVTGQTLTLELLDRQWKIVQCMIALVWQEVDLAMFKVGWTVFIRYAEARREGGRLGDGMDAMFPDDAKLITTVPTSLAHVLAYDTGLAARSDGGTAASLAADSVCRNCEENTASKLCSGCKVSAYCSRECQTAHWKDHKSSCRIFAALRDIHLPVNDDVQGVPPRSYSARELQSAPPESRMQTEWIPFKKNAWIRDI